MYAVPGIESNVYFDNVCLALNLANYSINVTCGKGIQQAERWTFVPTEQDVGAHPFTIEVRDATSRIVAKAESIIQVVPRDVGSSKSLSLLTIGDSLTQPMLYQARLLDLCKAEGNPQLRLVGHAPSEKFPDFRTEGYGGWTAERFTTHFKDEERQHGDWRV